MADNLVYGYAGPPFNFLGHFSATQWKAFQSYVNARTKNFPAIQQHYQIRAAQLRKTAGLLEKFYATVNDIPLNPTFNKLVWKPGPQGHFYYPFRDDHLPMVAMSQIKSYMREQFQRMDESVFSMNQLRNIIEKTEDKAQIANIATTDTTRDIASLITQINSYFKQPRFETVLVDDVSNVYPAGTSNPRYSWHNLNPRTRWEIEQVANPAGTGASVNMQDLGT